MRGRIRTAKPEVLKDEELWDLEVSTGLPLFRAFQGLWFYADREGRFEWRPRALKSDVLPYWDGDFSAVLDALARGRFIVKYTVDGKEYGVVRTLTKHQRFDHREPASTLPPPPDPPAPGTPGHAQESPGHARVEGKGRELEGKGVGTESARGAPRTLPEVPGLVKTQPPPAPHPGRLGPSKREQRREAEAARLGVTPTLRYQFDPAWEPNEAHRARGLELGLTDPQMLERAEDCRRKPIKNGFTTEDDHFFRELSWLAADLKKQRFQGTRHERDRFENPGRDRAS